MRGLAFLGLGYYSSIIIGVGTLSSNSHSNFFFYLPLAMANEVIFLYTSSLVNITLSSIFIGLFYVGFLVPQKVSNRAPLMVVETKEDIANMTRRYNGSYSSKYTIKQFS